MKDARQPSLGFWLISLLAWLPLVGLVSAQGEEPEPVPVIDVLVVWTPGVPQQSGSPQLSLAEDLINQANTIFLNSHAKVRLRLAHATKVAFQPEVRPWLPDVLPFTLDRLLDPADGHLDEVHALRDQHNADLVVLLVEWAPGMEGFAAPGNATAEQAFGVLSLGAGFEFTRLVGRLLGCGAQLGTVDELGFVPQAGTFADSHATVGTNATYGIFASVMGIGPSPLPLFSNPDLSCYGRPMGLTGRANNVRTLNARAAEVAAFRPPASFLQPPVVTWRTPSAGAVFRSGTTVPLSLTVANGETTVKRIELFSTDPQTGLVIPGQPALLNLAGPPFELRLTNAAAGWHRWQARAVDSNGIAGQAEIEFRVRADNDEFANRRPLPTPGGRVPASLDGMALEPGEPSYPPDTVEASGWFTWTAPADGLLRAEFQWTAPAWPARAVTLHAFRGDTLATLTALTNTAQTGRPLILPVRAGETVQLAAGCLRANQPGALAGELVAHFSHLPSLLSPGNDAYENRIALRGVKVQVAGHNFGATGDTNSVWQTPSGPSAWWTWIPPDSGVARFRAISGQSDHYVWLFSGTDPAHLVPIASGWVTDPPSGFLVQGGQPVQIAVLSTDQGMGPFHLEFELLPGAPNDAFPDRHRQSGRNWTEEIVFPGRPEPGDPTGVGRFSAWWEWTAPESGAVILWSGFTGSAVAVFTGDSLATLTPADYASPFYGGAVLNAVAGSIYQIAVSWDQVPALGAPGFAPTLRLLYPAANDRFDQRIPLAGAASTWNLPDRWGTLEPGERTDLAGSLWFTWKAPAAGKVTISFADQPDPQVRVAVFRGSALPELLPVLSARAVGERPGFLVEVGAEYQIAVEAYVHEYGIAPVRLRLELTPPPANDLFAARPVISGRQHSLQADTGLATAQAGEPTIPSLPAEAGTVWWRWVAPADGLLTVSSTDGALGVFRQRTDGSLLGVAYAYPNQFPQMLGVRAGDALELMLAGSTAAAAHLSLRPPWENDAFAGRMALPVNPWQSDPLVFSVSSTSHGASKEAGESLAAAGTTGHSRWWTWRTPVPATATLVIESATPGIPLDTPAHVEQFRGSDLASLERVAWRTGLGYLSIRFHAVPGFEYPLVVDAVGGTDTGYTVKLVLTPDGAPPANDSFSHATVLSPPIATAKGTHRTATTEPGEPNHAGQPPSRSLWWRWTAGDSGVVRVRARSADFDYLTKPEFFPPNMPASPSRPLIVAYQGDTLTGLTPLGDSRATSHGFESELRFNSEGGQTYSLMLCPNQPARPDTGDFELEVLQLPDNDQGQNARPVSGDRVRLTGMLVEATLDGGWIPQRPSSPPNPSLVNVWWQWTAPAEGWVILRNRNANQHDWAVWGPRFVTSFDRHFGWEDTRREFHTLAGEVWNISVYGKPTDTTPVDIELEAVGVPSNDNFANRIALAGESVRTSARADNTSREPGEPTHGVGSVGLPYGLRTNAPSLWWSWTAPRSGNFVVSTSVQQELLAAQPGSWDAVARADCFVYRGNSLAELQRVAETEPDTTSPPSGLKQLIFSATAGVTYQIALCPLFPERRLWDDARYFAHLAIAPARSNLTPDTALELAGTTAWVTGNLRSVPTGLWWRWTAPAGGQVSLLHQLGGAPPNLRVSVTAFRRDDATGSLVPVETPYWTMAWDRMVNYFAAEAGQTYWLNVKVTSQQGWLTDLNSQDLPFDLSLSLVRRSQDNDAFSQRERLSGPTVVLTGDNTGATREPDEPLHTGLLGRGSLWWEWTAPRAGRWTLANLARWSPPLLVELYRGGSLTTLTSAAAWRNPLKNEVVFDAGAGETFVVAVDNPGRWEGPFQLNLVPSTPPPNDLFAKRAVLRGAAPDWTGTNTGALREEGEPAHAGSPALASVWWSWTAAVSAPTVLTVTPGDDTTLWGTPAVAIYRGDALSSLVPVADNRLGGERSKALVFRAEAGDTYHLALSTPPDETGIYRLTLSPTNAPANDHFDRRIALNGSRIQTTVSSAGATLESEEPNLLSPLAGSSLWWTWTAPASGRTTIDTSLSTFDTRLAVFHGDSLASLSLMALNDDQTVMAGSQALASSRVALEAVAGTSYQIQLGGVGGAYGWATLTILGPDVPPPELAGAGTPEQSSIRRLRLVGSPGQTVWIQSSEDLLNWQWVGSVRFVETEAEWEDPGLSFEVSRFYRLVLPP